MDQFAYDSHQKAIRAIEAGAFKEQIVPVITKVKGKEVIFDTDEGPRAETSLEQLAKLRPNFKKTVP